MIKHIAAIVLAATSFAASAADQSTGFYIGLDAGKNKVDSMNDDTSAGVFAGYKFNQFLALEAGYRAMGSYEYGTYSYDPFSRRSYYVSADVKMKQTAVSVIGTIPLAGGFSMFGRLGYNKLSADVHGYSASDNGTLAGVGVDFAFTQNFSARVEYQRPASDTQNLSAGLSFKF